MKQTVVSLVAVVLTLGVSSVSAQQPQPTIPPYDLSGCWTLTVSEYYNATDRVTVPPYDYMQQLLVDPTPNQQGLPNQMLPKGTVFPTDVITFTNVSGDFYTGVSNANSDQWLAHVVTGGTLDTPVYYVPMSTAGLSDRNFSTMANAYIAVHAGIADSNTRITGTWVDSRGAMSLTDLQCTDQGPPCPNAASPYDVSLHTIIFPVQTGRYTLDKVSCP